MAYETDNRLKGFLDTNQLAREQLCASILSLDRRFDGVKPRHPRGGPDGGRDIEAIFNNSQKVFAAVGFVNQAKDSSSQKNNIKKKFATDLKSALEAEPKLEVFIFFTNLNLTIGEKDSLIAPAIKSGIVHCEIFDRERICMILDGQDGLAARFQHLNISMSETEQAAFFARWGNDIQHLISDKFNKVEKLLNRIEFLSESENALEMFSVIFELDKEYQGSEIGHFRVFGCMHLVEIKNSIFGIYFGSADNSTRSSAKLEKDIDQDKNGADKSLCGGYWEERICDDKDLDKEKLTTISTSSSVGRKTIKELGINFGSNSFIRIPPYLKLKDIDGSMLMFLMNESLSKKIKGIHIYANAYKIAEIDISKTRTDDPNSPVNIPMIFTENELKDKWVRMIGNMYTTFNIRFSETTPVRYYNPEELVFNKLL